MDRTTVLIASPWTVDLRQVSLTSVAEADRLMERVQSCRPDPQPATGTASASDCGPEGVGDRSGTKIMSAGAVRQIHVAVR